MFNQNIDSIQGGALPPFARAVFEQIRADCALLKAPYIEVSGDPTWQDLYHLEITLLSARDELDLRRSAWFIRLRFRNVAGEHAYTQYLASSPPDPATAERQLLYADLLSVLRRTYYLMILYPAGDHVRRILFAGSAATGLAAIAAIVAVVMWPNDNYVLSFAYYVAQSEAS